MLIRIFPVLLLFAWLPALATPPPPVTLRLVAGGLAQPVEMAHAGDASGRLFVVERAGRIRIVQHGALLPAPFLDIQSIVLDDAGERGLLGLAFHPRYAANRRFYVFYTREPDGALRVSEFLGSNDADLGDAGSERPLLTIPHPAGNHNGGRIAFGPDGYLYIGTGDGGGGGDPDDNGQNKDVLLGKLLRIDVDAPAGYAIPPDNPFVGVAGADEVWAYGLRNPWKFGFDRQTGDLYIADVGQDAWEEINFEPAGSPGGRNYGWDDMEGPDCYEPPAGCLTADRVLPVIALSHSSTSAAAVIGGYVYRGGRSASLRGYYVYGDLGILGMFAAQDNGDGTYTSYALVNGPGGITAFGEDEAGELYVLSYNGTLHAIDGPLDPVSRRPDFDGDGKSDILWRNSATGENYLYPMDGLTILPAEGYLRTVADQSWQVAGNGDFNGDGKADVLWRNASTGENYVYLMNGKDIAGEGYLRTVADPRWKVAGIGDLDGDGKDDIVWRNAAAGENYLYPMDGLSIKGTEGYLRTVANQDWQVAGVGDLDGDGKADLLWRNSLTGENYLYPMNGTAILGTEGYLRTVADTRWKVAGVADFDGDGKADLLWRNSFTGENYLYPMDGTTILGTEGYLRTVADLNWRVAGAGDYDGDGKADILWRHGTSGENYVYPMEGTAIKPEAGYIRTVADLDWQLAAAPAVQACNAATPRLPNQGLAEAPGAGGCPAGMAPVEGFCIDKYEASLENWSPFLNPGAASVRAVSIAGAIPQGYINQVQASAACANAGKRLCTNTEWLRACRTANAWAYPYGPARVAGACNDSRQMHPVDELFPGDPGRFSKVGNACINQLEDTVARTGAYAACASPEGVHDMAGNQMEWTSDPAGTFRGGNYIDATLNGPGCNYATTAHDVNHSDYSTGFRCCADP